MRIFYLILFFQSLNGASQELLLNGGFEIENICTEYKVNCAPEAWIYNVPSFVYYFNDPSVAATGNHYVALIAAQSNRALYRTFVRSRMVCGLQKGKTYRLQVSVKSVHSLLDSMGVYFSSSEPLYEKRPAHTLSASAYFADANRKAAANDTGWQSIALDYIANGTEAFITLGNFKKTGVYKQTGVERENNFFVLLDNISLTPADRNERLCADWKRRAEEISGQAERHDYLAKSILFYRKKPPPVTLPAPTKTLKIDTLIIPDVLFATNSFMLNRQASKVLDSFARMINHKPMDSVVVNGHTDARGEDGLNEELSRRRALTVTAFLQKMVQGTFYTKGWGSTKPVAANNTAAGRQRNRRVEIYLYLKE